MTRRTVKEERDLLCSHGITSRRGDDYLGYVLDELQRAKARISYLSKHRDMLRCIGRYITEEEKVERFLDALTLGGGQHALAGVLAAVYPAHELVSFTETNGDPVSELICNYAYLLANEIPSQTGTDLGHLIVNGNLLKSTIGQSSIEILRTRGIICIDAKNRCCFQSEALSLIENYANEFVVPCASSVCTGIGGKLSACTVANAS